MSIEHSLLQALGVGLAAASLGLYWACGASPKGRLLPLGPDGTATATGTVARWEKSLHLVSVGPGQCLEVRITSVQGVAVFAIKGPGPRGHFLPGAAEKDVAQSWAGRLPQAGIYQVAVRARGGAAGYCLRVGVSD